MDVMGVWAFILCTWHRWRKTKEERPWTNTKQIFPEQKTKKSFALRHLCPVHEVLSGNLESISTWTNCQFIWSGKVYIWLLVWEFQKLFLCLNKVMHVENWETDQLQHYLYVDISYSLFHGYLFVLHVHNTNCEHFHKWFGTLYRDNEGTAYSIIISSTASLMTLLHVISL